MRTQTYNHPYGEPATEYALYLREIEARRIRNRPRLAEIIFSLGMLAMGGILLGQLVRECANNFAGWMR
jgi:hypothetical protein